LTYVVTTIARPIKFVAKIIYKGLGHILKFIFDGVASLTKGILKLIRLIFSFFKGTVSGIFGFYIGILTTATKMSLRMGIIGDLLLTIFALFWMFWPLIATYYLAQTKIYYIPAGVFSVIFLMMGYKAIKNVTGK